MIVTESGTTNRTHLAPLYHPDILVNPDTYIVIILLNKNFVFESISRDATVDQANLLLFPIEIARIVSILIQGTDHGGRKDASLKQVTTEQFHLDHATYYIFIGTFSSTI